MIGEHIRSKVDGETSDLFFNMVGDSRESHYSKLYEDKNSPDDFNDIIVAVVHDAYNYLDLYPRTFGDYDAAQLAFDFVDRL